MLLFAASSSYAQSFWTGTHRSMSDSTRFPCANTSSDGAGYCSGDDIKSLVFTGVSGDITIDSSGSSAIGNNKITEAMLKAVDSPSDEECLTYESTVGDFEWQTCGSSSGISDVVDDTTPQLGGDLDVNSHTITGLASDTQIIFNSGGSLSGNSGLIYDGANLTLGGNMFMGASKKIDFNSGDITITPTTNGILFAGASSTSGYSFDGVVKPASDASVDLGITGTRRWRNIFISGSLTGNVTGDLTGNASTATALAANGSNCSAGSFPLGVDASGVAESCTDVWTEAENTSAAYLSSIIADSPLSGFGTSASHLTLDTSGTWSGTASTASDLTCTDCIGTTEIADSYVLNTTDSMSGALTVTGAPGLIVGNGATSAGSVQLNEDSDNGTNKITLASPSSLASDVALDNELVYLDGVTSSIQTQLDGKQASGSYLTAETNNLEGDGASGIADTEVFIGTGAGTGNYAALSGDVTMANTGAVSIGANKITEAMLKAVDSASDEECLTYETTTGDFEWQSCGGGGSSFADNTGITDDSSNEQLWFQKTASAVNYLEITNSATGNAPQMASAGSDTNVDLKLAAQGTGHIVISGMKFPSSDGTAGYNLETDGAGNLYWDPNDGGDYVFSESTGSNSLILDTGAASGTPGEVDGLNSIGIGWHPDAGNTRPGEIIAIMQNEDTPRSYCDGNAGVCIGRYPRMDCINGLLIGDTNHLLCDQSVGKDEKSAVVGNDNDIGTDTSTGGVEHASVLGHNVQMSGCTDCGAFGFNIVNNYDGSYAIGNTDTHSGTLTVGSEQTLWTELYIKPKTETTATLETCDSSRIGQIAYDNTKGSLAVCDGSSSWMWFPKATANRTMSSWFQDSIDETSEANWKAYVNLEIGTDVEAYDAGLAAIAGASTGVNKLTYWSNTDTASTTDFTAAGRAILDDADAAAQRVTLGLKQEYCVALSDQTSDLATGTAKGTLYLPAAATVIAVRGYVNTAPTGSTIIVDINEAGTTLMSSTKLSIDASEKTSGTAASAAALTDTAIAANAEITFDIDQVGSSTTGKGLVGCIEVGF